jgi:hypothetical protein
MYVLMLRSCLRLFIWLPKFTSLGQQAGTEQPTWRLFRRKIPPPVTSDSRWFTVRLGDDKTEDYEKHKNFIICISLGPRQRRTKCFSPDL